MTPHVQIDLQKAQNFLTLLSTPGTDGHGTAELVASIEQIKAIGVLPGDAVLIVMPNSVAFAQVVFAILLVGAVPVLLPSAAPASRTARIGDVIGAAYVVAPSVQETLTMPGTAPCTIMPGCQIARLRNASDPKYEAGHIILLTSGTSGIFSGCLFTIDALLRNAGHHAAAIGQRASDTVLINLPTYYSYAFVAQLLATYVVGNRAVISGPPFTPANYERVLQEQAITVSSITPLMVEAWLQEKTASLPQALRCLTIGGAALSADGVADVLRRNSSLELYVTYGLTECGPRVATLAAHLAPGKRHGSVGLPLPNVNVSLRSDASENGHEGELIVETDTGMLRRIGRTDADPLPLPGGRVRIATRDLFRQDDEGYLFFKGRRSGAALIRGEKVDVRSVCRLAEAIDGVTRAEAWVRKEADGSENFTLDIYCRDHSLSISDIKRQLSRVLLRNEQPGQIVLHPGVDPGWRKTQAAPLRLRPLPVRHMPNRTKQRAADDTV